LEHRFFKRKEVWIVAAVAVVCLVAFFLLRPEKQEERYALVMYYNREIGRIPLDEDGIYRLEGDLPVTFEVKDGRIRFIDSVCPDHLCEGFGWLGGETDFDIAICMPAGITVQVIGGS